MGTSNWTTTSRRTVIAYFTDGEDAHRAINELIEQGYRAGDIGAAFHSGSYQASTATMGTGGVGDTEIRPVVGPNSPGAGSTVSGPASDTSAVTSAGLSTGGGTANSGADRPGPIPGAEIPSSLPSTLPHTIKSSIPSTLHPEASMAPNPYPATGGFHESRSSDNPRSDNPRSENPRSDGANWWDKLKHIFGSEGADSARRSGETASADKTSSNFGTGEGHLGAYPDFDYAYSGAAFESAFFGMGIPSDHARQLAGRIRSGGAIVTVDAGPAKGNAEEILERNHGTIRYETATSSLASEDSAANREGRVQLFGRVQSVYPGYVSSSGSATRKAS
jgi:hypothetical protein